MVVSRDARADIGAGNPPALAGWPMAGSAYPTATAANRSRSMPGSARIRAIRGAIRSSCEATGAVKTSAILDPSFGSDGKVVTVYAFHDRAGSLATSKQRSGTRGAVEQTERGTEKGLFLGRQVL